MKFYEVFESRMNKQMKELDSKAKHEVRISNILDPCLCTKSMAPSSKSKCRSLILNMSRIDKMKRLFALMNIYLSNYQYFR